MAQCLGRWYSACVLAGPVSGTTGDGLEVSLAKPSLPIQTPLQRVGG